MASSLCLNSCAAVPGAAKQILSSLILLHKFPSSLGHKYCISKTSASLSVSITDKKEIRSTDLVALEYADLHLTDKISQELGHVRIRQHVNPLSSSFSVPAPVPNWDEVFKDPTLPLMVDIGSGSGRFLLWLAKQNPDSKNYLGLEIRAKLVKRAEFWVKELALSNIHFMFANAAVSFKQLVSTYPGPLALVSILCPDPHFKKRHHKRRVVRTPLVNSILTRLMPEGKVFIQSDVVEVAEDMRKQFDEESGVLQHIDTVDPSVLCDNEGWLLNNPMGIRTEREIHAEFEGAKIYRRLYQKRKGY
ncbi:tRNA (guanine-N(7)-)-methyltransferase-like [Gossypium australe]|uniref:tRNA (guanine(46)-N(7))-methyltransferase n=1 Tax=Gossypium australe TaxID=47621 RepID=A0A5B6VUA0_9ROSI|nr:tRNA (guanine-N(7)-)-methyltransferase-like [Gossypium australe]